MSTPGEAMGRRDGDYLELRNAWARVEIVRHVDDSEEIPRPVYLLRGDAPRHTPYTSLCAAVVAAWDALAHYEYGRGD